MTGGKYLSPRLARAHFAALTGGGAFALALLGIWLGHATANVSAIWPANAFIFVRLASAPVRTWAELAAISILGIYAANIALAGAYAAGVGLAVSDVTEALVAAVAARVLVGPRISLERFSTRTVWLAAIMVCAPAIGALPGATVVHFAFGAAYAESWWTWYASSVLGQVLFTPLLLTVQPSALGHASARTILHFVALLVTSAVAVAVVCTRAQAEFGLLSLLIPPFVWGALRFGIAGSATAGMVTAVGAAIFTSQGQGPFILAAPHLPEALLNVQMFLVGLSLTGATLGLLESARATALRETEQHNRQLRAIQDIQAGFITGGGRSELYADIVSSALALTRSSAGALAIVRRDALGTQSLEVAHTSGDGWGPAPRRIRPESVTASEPPSDPDAILALVVDTAQPVTADNPATVSDAETSDTTSSPTLVGLPLFAGGELVGAIGLSDGGVRHDQSQVQWLAPFTDVCGLLLAALRSRDERIAAEQDRDVAETRLRRFADNLPHAIALKDEHLRFDFANARFLDWFGLRPAELLGRTIAVAVSEQDAETIHQHDRAAIAAGAPVTSEYDIKFADGALHRMLATRFPVLDPVSSKMGLGLIAIDVTEVRRNEAHLHRAQKMEAVGQLTGGVAHDFNNLLTVILGNMEMLLPSLEVARQRAMATSVVYAAKRGAELTKGLLAFGRRQVLAPKVTDVNNLLTDLVPLLQRTLGEKYRIQIELAEDARHPTIDRAQLENAVINLAFNSRDAMPNGGSLTIETANLHVDEAYARKQNMELDAGDYVMIAISDTGTGMPAEVVERAFEPFFTTKETGRGSGLGLSMVYGFIKQSNGHVRIYSEPGIGTSVKLYLPAPESAREPEPDAKAVHAGAGRGETVLVVEDDADVLDVVRQILEAANYQVLEARDGAEALAVLTREPDVAAMLSDVVLPGPLNGPQLVAEARSMRPELKVVYTSGYARGAANNSLAMDPDDEYLVKPFRRDELLERLRKVLDQN